VPRLVRFFRADDPFEAVEEFPLSTSNTWTIGRSEEVQYTASDAARIASQRDVLMSTRHAMLSATARSFEIADTGSKNGTFVNGRRVEASLTLLDGDIIECGHSFFMYRDRDPFGTRFPDVVDASELALPPLYYQLAPILPYVASDVSIHLQGETGTGKEVVARAIHELSGRTGPFVAVNCAAIPDGLFESQLFGCIKGAFSGASAAQRGLVLAANDGTLLLDEIGELSVTIQAKLLRVLELKEVLPLGSSTPIPVNFRLISATLKDIKDAVAEGRFRADLLGRLGINLSIPRLRDHKEELGRLISTFLVAELRQDAYRTAARPRVHFTLPAARALVNYSWPYNIRELKQVIESALIGARAYRRMEACVTIKLADLPAPIRAGTAECAGTPLPVVELRQLSDEQILAALEATKGNRAEAAKLLAVSERTIFRRIRKLARPTSE
jgi:transcriptional regulator with PAS, ATPase and Fis domain